MSSSGWAHNPRCLLGLAIVCLFFFCCSMVAATGSSKERTFSFDTGGVFTLSTPAKPQLASLLVPWYIL